jgi:energy-coupling factor transporter ATP-binding protein EcfA2
MPSAAQATEPDFQLHTLGWKEFQRLCATILSDLWGQPIQTFFDSNDGGRDGAFHGTWSPKPDEKVSGSFTVQCKFKAAPGKHLAFGDVSDELAKAARLAAKGLADHYLLFTNAHLDGVVEEQLRAAFLAVPAIKSFQAFGGERISLMIRQSSKLRMLVPRIYGLGDLSQILDERSYAQAQELLSTMGDDLRKFVITQAYQQSAHAIQKHGFVLLLGEPACGKSTIAASLALGASDIWGCSALKVRSAEEFVRHWNPHDPKQFFWVDDAFGATQLDFESLANWNRALPQIHAAIQKGARVLFTSRDYIFRNAQRYLKISAFPAFHTQQVVIQVQKLTAEEKQQILYNHIRLGFQPIEYRKRLKRFLTGVAAHPRFMPEIARRLGDPAFTQHLVLSEAGLAEFVERPLELLCSNIKNLDDENFSALALVFMRGGRLTSPVQLTEKEAVALERLGGTLAGVRQALNALNGSLVLMVLEGGGSAWRFKHPTILDALATVVAEDPELLDVYLAGAALPQIFSEVVCGEIEREGAKVRVPASRFQALIERIHQREAGDSNGQRRLHRFLSRHCDGNFLKQYADTTPGFVEALNPGAYLHSTTDIDVLARLHECGLLPEAKRRKVISVLQELAVSIPDAGVLDEGVRELFTTEELADTKARVRAELIGDLENTISNWRWNFERGNDPESYFEDLVSALKSYRDHFEPEVETLAKIDQGLKEIRDLITELRSEGFEEPDYESLGGGGGHGGSLGNDERSIFDDVDA